MLLAGADVGGISVFGGALAFDVGSSPSGAGWHVGSAFIYIMLIAGACADNTSALGGALAFDVSAPPSVAWWYLGSAL